MLSMPKVTQCILEFSIELAKDHFFGIVTHYCSWQRRDSTSWASLFRFTENEHDQPKMVAEICLHLLPILKTVVANNVSWYMFFGNLLCHN